MVFKIRGSLPIGHLKNNREKKEKVYTYNKSSHIV